MQRDLRSVRDYEPRSVCGVVAAVIGGVATVGSALIGSNAAKTAAKSQENAANNAQQTQLQMYNTTRGDLMPYNQGGQQDFAAMNRLLLGNPAEQQAALEGMPGYQFALNQGLKSVQNSATARGLGVSGAAMKGAATYATGLADQTYGNQVNRLLAGAQLGENAGAMTGQAGSNAANGIANAQIGAGNAAAGGAIGSANAWSGALGNLGNLATAYGMYQGGYGGGGGGYNYDLPVGDLQGLY